MNLLLLALSFISVGSWAQVPGQPFQLPAGEYKTECWRTGLTKFDDTVRKHYGYDEGVSTIVNQGAVNIEYAQYKSGEMVSNSVEIVTTTDLGNGEFKRVTESTDTYSYDGQTVTEKNKFEVVVKVDENWSQNLTIKTNDETEKPAMGMSHWQKMADGRIVLQKFIREKYSYTAPDDKIGERLVANSLCIYAPLN